MKLRIMTIGQLADCLVRSVLRVAFGIGVFCMVAIAPQRAVAEYFDGEVDNTWENDNNWSSNTDPSTHSGHTIIDDNKWSDVWTAGQWTLHELWVGDGSGWHGSPGGNGGVTVKNGGYLTTSEPLILGGGSGSVTGTAWIDGGGTLQNNGPNLYIGAFDSVGNAGAIGTLNMNGGTLTSDDYYLMTIGGIPWDDPNNYGRGHINIYSGTIYAYDVQVGSHGGIGHITNVNGDVNVSGYFRMGVGESARHGTGYVDMQGGTLDVDGDFIVQYSGDSDSVESTFTQSDGTVTLNGSSVCIGRSTVGKGIYTINGGYLNVVNNGDFHLGGFWDTGSGADGELNVGGSGYVHIYGSDKSLIVGRATGSSGVVNQTGGRVEIDSGAYFGVWMAAESEATGTYNLNGGRLVTPGIARRWENDSTKAFNFNGGTLEANKSFTVEAAQDSTFTTTLGSNGGTIDTANYTVTWDLPLTTSSDGSLTKTNSGTLILNGANNTMSNLIITGGSVTISNTTTAAGTVTAGEGLGLNGTLNVAAGKTLGMDIFEVGHDGATGSVDHDGTITVTDYCAIGHGANTGSGSGAYQIDSGALTVGGDFSVNQDRANNCTFTQNGGTVTLNGNLAIVGRSGNGGKGTYTISGGTLDANPGSKNFVVGDNQAACEGELQIGGTAIVNTDEDATRLIVGFGPGSGAGGTGTATLAGGRLTARDIAVGQDGGSGSVVQTGGTNTVSGFMSLGLGAPAANGSATYQIDDGELTVAGDFSVNEAKTATCTFTQTGGAVALNGNAYIGRSTTGQGVYTISGGTLTNANSDLYVGGEFGGAANANGELNVSGSASVNVLGDYPLVLARAAGTVGTVNQTGGTVTIDSASAVGLWLAPGGAGASGTYNLNGGTLVTPDITPDNGAGTKALAINGGTLQANDTFTVESETGFTSTLGANGGTIDTDGNNITWNADLTTSTAGSLTKEGNGALILAGSGNSMGGLYVNGGTVNHAGTTTITGADGDDDKFFVGDGEVVAANGTFVMASGTLNVQGTLKDSLVIGRDGGEGAFVQNSGTVNFNATVSGAPICEVYVGASNTGFDEDPTYTLNDGVLDMNGKKLGVGLGAGAAITGILAQVGGVITNVGTLNLGPLGGGLGEGQFTMTGGAISIGSGGVVSDSGNYAISLGGGTVAAGDSWSSSLDMTLSGTGGDVTFDTAGNSITLSGTLSGDGGLCKTNSGTLTLNHATTFSGITRVVGGTLVLSAANALGGATDLTVETGASVTLSADEALNTTMDVALNGTASMTLNNSTTESIGDLYFDGVPQANGTWGRLGGDADHKDGRFTGDGLLLVGQPRPLGTVFMVY